MQKGSHASSSRHRQSSTTASGPALWSRSALLTANLKPFARQPAHQIAHPMNVNPLLIPPCLIIAEPTHDHAAAYPAHVDRPTLPGPQQHVPHVERGKRVGRPRRGRTLTHD